MGNNSKPKRMRRKVTQEQVDAMNRQLDVRGDQQLRYGRGSDGRLTTVKVITYMPVTVFTDRPTERR